MPIWISVVACMIKIDLDEKLLFKMQSCKKLSFELILTKTIF